LKHSPLPTAGAAVLLAALLGVTAGWSQAQERANPHAFMEDAASCTDCHRETPVRGEDDYTTVTFTDSIVSLCSRCHEDAHFRDEHPLEIRPEIEVPEDFHLDGYYTLTCATCHDPHGEHESEERYIPPGFLGLVRDTFSRRRLFPTYFLRLPNTSGQMCLGCHREEIGTGEEMKAVAALKEYVGSESCRECHPDIYDEWKKTLHSRNFLDAAADPGVLRGTFEDGKPFPPEKVLFTVGEHWTQRYIVEGRRGLMVTPESWSITAGKWVGGGSFKRPWLKYCAGCHTTALDPFTGDYAERGTGCESCHGPGRKHLDTTDQYDTVNPTLLVRSRRDMICEACHTSGHDRSGAFRYPVAYQPGEDLMRYYRGLVPKSGQGTESYTGDGSYEDRHRQFLFWSSRLNILEGASCDVCTSHSRPEPGQVQQEYALTPSEACGTCHRDVIDDPGEHSGHALEQAGCLDCHVPGVTASGEDFDIHDHKFQFGTPPSWMIDVGDPCERCHPGGRGDESALSGM
jgi:hypothetical protein